MNRRQFLKSLGMAAMTPTALLVHKSKSNLIDPTKEWWPDFCWTGYRYRLFVAHENQIRWSAINDSQNWPENNWLILPTKDTCENLLVHGDRLLWYGKHEVWEILHLGVIHGHDFFGARLDSWIKI